LPATAFEAILRSALRAWPADKVFTEFSPLLKETKGDGNDKRDDLARAILDGNRPAYIGVASPETAWDDVTEKRGIEWDARWLDAAVQANQLPIVWRMARPGHAAAIAYLLKLAGAKTGSEDSLIVRALARCHYPAITDVFLNLVAKKIKGAKNYGYDLLSLLGTVRYLPVTDLPKLDAFAAKLDEKFVDPYLEALAPLRAKTAAPAPAN
jgi:hypothetical protein